MSAIPQASDIVLTANTYEIGYAEILAHKSRGPATIRVKTLSNWHIDLVKDDKGIMTLITYKDNIEKCRANHKPTRTHYESEEDWDSDCDSCG